MRVSRFGATLFTLVALFAGAAACSRGKSGTAPRAPVLRDGVYRFSERPSQSNQTIDGEFTVLADTVWIDAMPGPCRYDDVSSSRGGGFVYRCAEVTFYFDRLDPVRKASYRTVITVQEKQTTCAEYGTDASGRRVCKRYETNFVERQVPVSGTLRPTRVGDPGA